MNEAASPNCPRCGSPGMIRKQVRKGPRAGLEMWSCPRWPDCRGVINIDREPRPVDGPSTTPIQSGTPGAYAQARFERERERARLKRRAALPLMVGSAIGTAGITFFAAQPLGVPIASLLAVLVGGFFMVRLYQLPLESLVWAKGIEGERKAAEYLEPLMAEGFVALFNRRLPSENGDIDCFLVGRTGVFTIETKNWGGRVEVRADRLWVGDHDRTWVVKQVYRQALAVQLALGEELTTHRVTVTPIICAVGGVKGPGRMVSGVHLVAGPGLPGLIAGRPQVFDDEAVQRIARLADQNLRAPYPWETIRE